MKITETDNSCPAWINFLTEVTDGNAEAIARLQEFAGSCLAPQSVWGKALVLSGAGCGKSVLMKILTAMVGTENTSYLSISDFRNEYHRAGLKYKWLNVSNLERPDVFDNAYFKSVVTGDLVNASVLHGDRFHFSPSCKLVFATNVQEVENRRCLSVDFKYRPVPPTPDLFHELMKEIDAIRVWAHKGLRRLIDQGCFSPGK